MSTEEMVTETAPLSEDTEIVFTSDVEFDRKSEQTSPARPQQHHHHHHQSDGLTKETKLDQQEMSNPNKRTLKYKEYVERCVAYKTGKKYEPDFTITKEVSGPEACTWVNRAKYLALLQRIRQKKKTELKKRKSKVSHPPQKRSTATYINRCIKILSTRCCRLYYNPVKMIGFRYKS